MWLDKVEMMENACEVAARRCWENMVAVCTGGFIVVICEIEGYI